MTRENPSVGPDVLHDISDAPDTVSRAVGGSPGDVITIQLQQKMKVYKDIDSMKDIWKFGTQVPWDAIRFRTIIDIGEGSPDEGLTIECLSPTKKVPILLLKRVLPRRSDYAALYYVVPAEKLKQEAEAGGQVCYKLPESAWKDTHDNPIWEDGEVHPSVWGESPSGERFLGTQSDTPSIRSDKM